MGLVKAAHYAGSYCGCGGGRCFLTGLVRVFDDRWCESCANSVPSLNFVTSRNFVEKLLTAVKETSAFVLRHDCSLSREPRF